MRKNIKKQIKYYYINNKASTGFAVRLGKEGEQVYCDSLGSVLTCSKKSEIIVVDEYNHKFLIPFTELCKMYNVSPRDAGGILTGKWVFIKNKYDGFLGISSRDGAEISINVGNGSMNLSGKQVLLYPMLDNSIVKESGILTTENDINSRYDIARVV